MYRYRNQKKGCTDMEGKTKIGILGGDERQLALCPLFAEKGFECATWGLRDASKGSYTTSDSTVRCVDWKCAVNGAAAVILPLPLSTDGVRLNCSFVPEHDTYIPRITELIEKIGRDTPVFAGKVPPATARFAREHGVRLTDYYESEEFQIKNAVPTAEGAIGIAISALDITLAGSHCAVVGYGRIGRTLAQRLCALGCRTTCIARSRRDLAWASCDGCTPLPLSEYSPSEHRFDAIFNTVPHMIFDRDVLGAMPRGSIIIDLASQGCGVDGSAAKSAGIRSIKALSLPGKTSPMSAGRIIFESVYSSLEREGVL